MRFVRVFLPIISRKFCLESFLLIVPTSLTLNYLHLCRQLLLVLALVAFGVQSLFPVGYMPAAISGGSYAQLCPAGLSDATMRILHPAHAKPMQSSAANDPHAHHRGHAAHTQHEATALQATEHNGSMQSSLCDFAVLTNAAMVGSYFTAGVLDAASAKLAHYLPQLVLLPTNYSRPPLRGPPTSTV